MADPIGKVLVVDDDRFVRMALSEALKSWGYEVVEAESVATARKAFEDEEPPIALLDIDLPDGSGLDILAEIKKQTPETIAIMITGNVDVNNTVAALRGGAHDFIGKPVRIEELRVTLRNAAETRTLRREVKQTRGERKRRFSFAEIIGDSQAMQKAIELARRVAGSDVNSILLNGETGTGKDLFARAIHYASERSDAPYLAINCAALRRTLSNRNCLATRKELLPMPNPKKKGFSSRPMAVTIFLDEIGEMDISLQAKLLRVLEEGAFRRVGGLKDLKLDARVIAASNRNLKKESEAGNFRLDLYFRLSVIQVDIPPLRDRGNDVIQLAEYYVEKVNVKRRGQPLKGLSAEVQKIFKHYGWSGNVRELRNVIERSSILEDGDMVTPTHLPADMLDGHTGVAGGNAVFALPADGVSLEQVEFELAKQAIERTHGNLTRASKLLDISRDQLRYKLRKAGYEADVDEK